jgi:hypothetical protein
VYIALRSDGAKGSGTIDDPYDGGTRNGTPLVLASLTFDPVEAMAMDVGTRHNCFQGDKVCLANVGGPTGALVRGEAYGLDGKFSPMDDLRTRIEDALLMAF